MKGLEEILETLSKISPFSISDAIERIPRNKHWVVKAIRALRAEGRIVPILPPETEAQIRYLSTIYRNHGLEEFTADVFSHEVGISLSPARYMLEKLVSYGYLAKDKRRQRAYYRLTNYGLFALHVAESKKRGRYYATNDALTTLKSVKFVEEV